MSLNGIYTHPSVTLGVGNSSALTITDKQVLTFDESLLNGNLHVDDLWALTGVGVGNNRLGTFTGSTISDNQTIKAALQEVETAIESNASDIATLQAASHAAATLGVGNSTALTLAGQEFILNESTLSTNLNLDDLQVLTGVAAGNDDLGSFPGVTISDGATIKIALQELETAFEAAGLSGTDLAYVASPTDGTVTSDTGTDATLTLADITNAGLLTPADFTKLSFITVTQAVDLDTVESDVAGLLPDVADLVTLSGVAANSVNLGTFAGSTISNNVVIKVALQQLESAVEAITGTTNLGYTASPTDGTVTSSTGTDATIPLATGVNAGLMAPADFTKLGGIEALADVTDETNVVAALSGATLTGVTVAGTDKVLIQDVDDTDNLKTVTAQSIANLYVETNDLTAAVTWANVPDANITQSSVTQHQGAIDHGSIAGLGDDDHSIYALLLGRTGGQTLIGGDAASNNLTLRSTSNVTKGNVIIEGPHLADEADPTKIIDVDISALTTATTRTWTVPDRNLDFTAGGTFVEADTTDTFTNKTFDANGVGNSITNIETADIAAGSKSGADATLVTGTAGTSGNLAEWNVDGDVVDSSLATADVVTGSSVDTFTNKTFDANGTGNSISNIEVADLANGTDGEIITWDAAGSPTTVGPGTSGQVLTSNGAGAAPSFQDVVGGLTWSEVTLTTQAMAVENAYVANNASQVDLTLPATAALGERVRVAGKGAGGWKISQNAGQTIRFGNTSSTTGAGGSLTADDQYGTIELVCVTANTDWVVLYSVGAFTIV